MIAWWIILAVAARVVPAVAIGLGASRIGLGRVAASALALHVGLAIAVLGGDALVAGAAMPATLGGQVAMLAREVAIGIALGIAAAVPVLAAELAGDWIAAALDEPATGTWSTATGAIGALVFFALGGHRALVIGLGASYRAAPAGADGLGVVATTATLFAAAVALAAPLLAAVAMATIVSAAIDRVTASATAAMPAGLATRLGAMVGLAAFVFAIAYGIAGLTRDLPLHVAH